MMKAVFCIALLATGLVLSAQVQFPTPTFRTGVNAVVLDVRVVDRDGRFIRDLDKDDFQVFEDDRRRRTSLGREHAQRHQQFPAIVRDARGSI